MKYVIFDLNIEQSAECSEAYSDGKIKRPKLYLRDNVMAELEEVSYCFQFKPEPISVFQALGKLMNLRLKPSDPVEWLAFQLMNISEMKKNQKKCQFKIDDHLRKPTGSQLDFKVLGTCTVVNIGMEKLHSFSPLPQCSTSAESTSAPDTLCGKRKLD